MVFSASQKRLLTVSFFFLSAARFILNNDRQNSRNEILTRTRVCLFGCTYTTISFNEITYVVIFSFSFNTNTCYDDYIMKHNSGSVSILEVGIL